MFTLDAVNELIADLREADIRADLDPGRLTLPGVWVQVAGWENYTLRSYATNVRMVLLVGDKEPMRVIDKQLELAAQVRGVVTYLGATARTQLMPDGSLVPALEIPLTLRTDI